MIPANMPSASVNLAKRDHYLELDGLRGVLAFMVMGYHFGVNTLVSQMTHGLVGKGYWAFCVDVFFILSGFVLAVSYFEKRLPSSLYFKKRVARLYPLHIFAMAIALWFQVMSGAHFSWQKIGLNLLFVQSLFGVDSINTPAWSASLEMYVPFLCLISYPFIKRLGKTGIWGVFSVFLAAGIWLTLLSVMKQDGLKIARSAVGLFSGVLLYRIYDSHFRHSVMPERRRQMVFYTLLIGLLALLGLADKWLGFAVMLYPVTCLLITLGTQTRSLLSTTPLQWLGRWSYSIYMLHKPVMWGFIVIYGNRLDGSIPIKMSIIIITLLLSAVTYEFIEKRGGKKINQLLGSARG
ncbi:MAG: acyltransferase [Verrucomicrobiales bacterium]|nr:acyltransferase [Verrucomicrobiales bacterium]